jgi:hypothetical protein
MTLNHSLGVDYGFRIKYGMTGGINGWNIAYPQH